MNNRAGAAKLRNMFPFRGFAALSITHSTTRRFTSGYQDIIRSGLHDHISITLDVVDYKRFF
jgi:hypothetical protein